jgi:geranylgeranyl pyrophosphate synthase
VAAAWITLFHAGNLIDDIQDGDLARQAQFETPDTAIAIGLAWIFFAFRMLGNSSITTESKCRISEIFSRAGISSSKGQFQDLISSEVQSNRSDKLTAYWDMVINKSGSICMAGAASGAACGTAQLPLITALGDYGTALGVVRQVLDDCRDVWIDTKNHKNRATLPLILRELITGDKLLSPPATEKQIKKLSQTKEEAYHLLTGTGVPDIIADILLEWRRRAMESLQLLEPSKARDALAYIFEYAMKPKLYNP